MRIFHSVKPMLFAVIIVSTVIACSKKSTEIKNCGCDGPSYDTVLNMKGVLVAMGGVDNKLWILKPGVIVNGNTVEQTFIICNLNSPLITDYTDTAKSGEIPVIFSGTLYHFCVPSDPAVALMWAGENIKVDSLKKDDQE